MSRTRRTFGLGAFLLLAVLGTAWALDRTSSASRSHEAPRIIEPARDGSAIPPAATPAPGSEDDRSDLVLSQG